MFRNELSRLWQYCSDPRVLVLSIVGLLAVAVWLMLRPPADSMLINTGFLVIGALLSIITVLLSDTIARRLQATQLASALRVELADRVARCCFDCEVTWNKWLPVNDPDPKAMEPLRVKRFAPFEPIVYPATAAQIATLKGNAPQALIEFYYRLAAWQRDVDNTADAALANRTSVPSSDVRRLAKRVHQTLKPGLRALKAISQSDEHWVEANAIAAYDQTRDAPAPPGSLRDRIARLLG